MIFGVYRGYATNVIFDSLHPADCELSPQEFKSRLSALVVEEYPDAVPKITVDEDYVSASSRVRVLCLWPVAEGGGLHRGYGDDPSG